MSGKSLRRILVANDRADGIEHALAKAAFFEHYSGAEITLLQTVYDPVAEEPPEVLPRAEQVRLMEALKAAERAVLHQHVENMSPKVASIDVQVIWQKDAAAAIVDTARRMQADLIIKPGASHHGLADFLHTPLDWALMRQAPCAVHISRGPSWTRPGRVLAAVDSGDVKHACLSREVLRTAAGLAAVLDAELHVVTAYPDLGQRSNALQVATDFAGIKADMRACREISLAALLADTGIAAHECHLLEGRPAPTVAALARRLEATLTVLGSAARQGVARLVLGNTAEDLAQRLDADLVTVREPWS
jgi:universal stress protein E